MNKLSRILAIGGILTAFTAAEAQNTNTGYFLDGYTYRYQLNPAFGGKRGFVGIPAIGNINLGLQGNVGLSSLIYKRDGRTVLFTNPMVSTEEVLKGFPDNARLQINAKVNILSFGFKGFGGYNALSVNARVNSYTGIPNTFVKLAKEGLRNTRYDLSNIGEFGNAFVEIGLTHSRDIKLVPGLRVGATVKFLAGMGMVDTDFKSANLTLDHDSWNVESNADMYLALPKAQFEFKKNDAGRQYINGVNLDGDGSIAPQGYGFAVDLGATFDFYGITFSAALLDLGFINYSNTLYASTDGLHTVRTDAFTFNINEDAEHSFDNEIDRLEDQLNDLYQLNDKGKVSRNVGIGTTLNLGAEYKLPIFKPLSFGILNSTYIRGKYTWNETRVSANLAPCNFFSVSASGSVGTFGSQFGWLVSLHPKGINIFAGMDAIVGKLSKQFVPLNTHANLNIGLNVTF